MAARIMVGRWPFFLPVCLLGSLACVSCSFGPCVLEHTHGLYNDSVNQVYAEQLLLNLVRLRYTENPSRLDVNSIAAQYELTGMAQATPFYTAQAAMMSNLIRSFAAVLPGGQVLGANRPTVSLTPADDNQTIRRFLTPLTADTMLFLTEIGWPVSTIFRLYADSLNGVPNAPEATGPTRDVLPRFVEFQRVMQLLQSVHDQGLIQVVPEETKKQVGGPLPLKDGIAINPAEAAKDHYEYFLNPVPKPAAKKDEAKDEEQEQKEEKKDGKDENTPTLVLMKRERKLYVHADPLAAASPEVQELAHLLGVLPGLPRYAMVVGPPKPRAESTSVETEIRIVPRSTVQALFYLSHGVIVPPEHLRCGIAKATVGPDGQVFDWPEVTRGLFTIHSCKQHRRPAHALVAVPYYGYWFYLDDRDQESKATFLLMLQLVRLDIGAQQLGGSLRGPLLTLPVGGR